MPGLLEHVVLRCCKTGIRVRTSAHCVKTALQLTRRWFRVAVSYWWDLGNAARGNVLATPPLQRKRLQGSCQHNCKVDESRQASPRTPM